MLKNTVPLASIALLAAIVSPCALANNGMYLTGYGFESVFMGGADVAVSRDAFAANNNPAGLTQITGQAIDGLAAAYVVPEGSHTDSYGNYRKPYTDILIGGYGAGAYARHLDNSPFAAGASLTVQGGLGWIFSGLNTRFGTRDDASALFTVIRLAPALAWKVSDQLSLGAGIGINYVSAAQELFPNTSDTSDPSLPFAGFRFKGASGVAVSTKLGLQYRPMEDVTIGMTYGSQTSIPIKNGSLRINFSDPGFGSLGVVRYDNAKLTGFRLPEELALGIAFRPTPRMLVSLQEKWYNWSEALNKLEISATNPRTPGAPTRVSIPASVDFVDQHLIEIGLAYDYNEATRLYIGANHGSRPIPDQNVSPIFQPIIARHYMLGASSKLNTEWSAAGGVEIYPLQSVTYDSPLFGSRANERGYNWVFQAALSRRW